MPVYDCAHARAVAVYAGVSDTDAGNVLLALSGYMVGTPNAGGITTLQHLPQAVATINPYFNQMRVNSDGGTVCGNQRAHYFSSTVLHEARHAYQGFMSQLQGNDRDQDFLVNAITIAPMAVFLDTALPREVCDENTINSDGTLGTLSILGYLGDMSADGWSVVSLAIEMDALMFAAGHS